MDIKPSKDVITFKLHNPCGLFNQVSCIENAVALSHYLKKDIIIHNVVNNPIGESPYKNVGIVTSNIWRHPHSITDNSIRPKITDLMEVATYSSVEYLNHNIESPSNILSAYFYNFLDNNENEEFFALGRRRFNPETVDNFNFEWTLGWYSTMFMNRPPEVDVALSKTKFKKEYYQLAETIAKSIGTFVGAHLRYTDHNFDSPRKDEISAGLDTLEKGHQIVIVTDEYRNPLVQETGALLLEQYIEREFEKEFKQLPFTDEVTLGLISNLVMHHAKDFIGTQGSTYTGYIQRHAGGRMRVFAEQPYEQTGPYTWNGYKYPKLRNAEYNRKINYIADLQDWDNRWWREWPESKLLPKLV